MVFILGLRRQNKTSSKRRGKGIGTNQSPSAAQQSPAAASHYPESVTWFLLPKSPPPTYENFAAKGKPSAENMNLHPILLRYHYGRDVTNIPREVSICFSCQIALSSVAELLAWSICRRRAFRAGSLSLIVHRHANTFAS